MAKVFLETSFFIRYFTADNKAKFKDCVSLIEIVESGKIRPYTSNIVIFEILFVLTKIYGFAKKESLDAIKKILSLRNITLVETTNTREAIKLFEKYNIKYPDCLISTQAPQGTILVTYDEDFKKIEKLTSADPANIKINEK